MQGVGMLTLQSVQNTQISTKFKKNTSLIQTVFIATGQGLSEAFLVGGTCFTVCPSAPKYPCTKYTACPP